MGVVVRKQLVSVGVDKVEQQHPGGKLKVSQEGSPRRHCIACYAVGSICQQAHALLLITWFANNNYS